MMCDALVTQVQLTCSRQKHRMQHHYTILEDLLSAPSEQRDDY